MSHDPSYRQAITQAWHLVWHNKILWIFGLLSAFVGQFGLGNFLGQIIARGDFIINQGKWTLLVPVSYNWANMGWGGKTGLVWLAIILLTVIIFVLFVSISSQGAIIKISADWYKKKKDDNFTASWHAGAHNFWPLLIINILQKLTLAGLLLYLTLVWNDWVDKPGIGMALMIGSLIITALLGMAIICVSVYAAGYVVTEKAKLIDAIILGWQMFYRHLMVSLELSLVLLFIGALLIMAIAIASALLFVPSVAIWLAAIFLASTNLMWLGFILGTLLWTIFIVWSGAVFNAFTTSAWIFLFMRMKHKGIVSFLAHHLKKFSRS